MIFYWFPKFFQESVENIKKKILVRNEIVNMERKYLEEGKLLTYMIY